MHRRRLAIVAALAVWMHSCSGYAQTLTVTPTAAKPGEPIVAALTDVPAINDVSLRTITWSSDDATKMLAVDSGQHVWATAGPHWIAAKLDTELRESRDILVPGPNWATDKSDVKLEKLVYLVDKTSVTVRAEFAVEGVVPPPTVPKTLAELAGDKAKALGTLYGGLAAQVDTIKTVAIFKTAHAKLLADQGLTGHGATAAIDKRLAVVLVDPLDHAKLRAVLQEFVAELGSLPPPVDPTVKITAATYIYEKDRGGVPPAVSAALSELNAAGIRATTFEEDATDSDDDVPEQYQTSLAAAREAGLPSLVMLAGATVVRVVKAPTTKEQVLEAAR